MAIMIESGYNRAEAVDYAHRWAFGRNPEYLNFGGIGGDCANFVSQCLYAGAGVMNDAPLYGWYYHSSEDRTPSWTGVEYFYHFVTANKSVGPYAREAAAGEMEQGDVIQLDTGEGRFHHMVIVVGTGGVPACDNILIAAHSYDSDNRPLNTYGILKARFLKIEGVRKFQ